LQKSEKDFSEKMRSEKEFGGGNSEKGFEKEFGGGNSEKGFEEEILFFWGG
jgi:hypothetical protein